MSEEDNLIQATDPRGLPQCDQLHAADDVDYTGLDGPAFLEALGTDAAKWAAAFRQIAIKLGYSDMDEGWLIGWFANAIMRQYDELQWQADPLRSRIEALETALAPFAKAHCKLEQMPSMERYSFSREELVEARVTYEARAATKPSEGDIVGSE